MAFDVRQTCYICLRSRISCPRVRLIKCHEPSSLCALQWAASSERQNLPFVLQENIWSVCKCLRSYRFWTCHWRLILNRTNWNDSDHSYKRAQPDIFDTRPLVSIQLNKLRLLLSVHSVKLNQQSVFETENLNVTYITIYCM